MEKFERYLASVNESDDWQAVKPYYDDAFHPDLVVVTADGEMNKAQWESMSESLVTRGGGVSDFEILARDGDEVHYRLSVRVGDNEMQMTAKGTMEDGRLKRVEPIDPERYSELVRRSEASDQS